MNKNYLKYLFKSKKVLAIFLTVSQIVIFGAIALTDHGYVYYKIDTLLTTAFIFATGLCFILPLLFISFINNKKACDIYMSLPIKRSEMIISTVMFMFLLVLVPQIVFVLVISLYYKYKVVLVLIASLITIIYSLVLLIFNTGIYLIGNNIIDSCVILGGYTLLPLIAELTISSFLSRMVYGIHNYATKILDDTYLITVAFNKISYFFSLLYPQYVLSTSWPPLFICLIVYLGIGVYSIKVNFIEREIERAESISDRFFGYKFLIHFYTICVILMIILSVSNSFKIMEILADSAVFIIAVVVLYIAATFIYRRSFSLKPMSILFLTGTILVSTGFVKIAYMNDGFGLSYKYNHNPENMIVDINMWFDESNALSFKEAIDSSSTYVYGHLHLEVKKSNTNKEEIYKFVNELRDKCIAEYFEGNGEYHNASFDVITNYDENSQEYWYSAYDSAYYYNFELDEEALNKLMEYGAVFDGYKETYDNNSDNYETTNLELSELLEIINNGGVK